MHRAKRAEIVLGQMLKIRPPGERFVEVLGVIDRHPGERVVRQPGFPFVGMIVPEIGGHGIDIRRQRAGAEPHHFNPVHSVEQLHPPAGDDAEHQLGLALGHRVDEEEPRHAHHEAQHQQSARIVDPEQHDRDERKPVGNQERGQDARTFPRARQAGDCRVEPVADKQRA